VKKSNCPSRSALKEIIVGSLTELVKNRKYYYNSTISPEYNRFTEEGEKELLSVMNLYAYMLIISDEAELDARAKEMVIKGLKGD
jgi:hypothetical protein